MRTILLLASIALACGACQTQHPSVAVMEAAPDFVIMCWEPPRKVGERFADPRAGLASLRECGFNTIGFVRPSDLPECERLGLKAIVRPDAGGINWRELSDDQIIEAVRSLINESGNSPAILGYYITDEPGVREFPALAKAVAAVKRLAPGKLAYINLYPNYATLGAPNLSQLGTDSYTEYLERFVREVKPQVISYDNYRVLFSDDLKNAKVAESYFTNLLEVRRVALANELPFWNIASSNQIRPVTPPPSPANLMLQAYTTLAAGAKGLTWFTYHNYGYHYAPVNNDGRRTATWNYLKMVNEQMNVTGAKVARMKSTGVYFKHPLEKLSAATLPGEFIADVTSSVPLMIGEFVASDGKRAAVVVNLSLERSAKIQVTPQSDVSKLHIVSSADGSTNALDKDNSLWLTAGQGVLLTQ